MAPGSPSSSTMFFGTTAGTKDNMEVMANAQHNHHLVEPKKQSDQPESSYPNADVAIVVSPTTLLDPNRHVCEVCYKGFPRKQNLTLHRRVHNLPFTLKTRTSKDPVARKVYLCPEPTCVHHNRSHALGDFGGLKKHYLRKHCTHKNYKCDTCCKAYTVQADLRAHLKICSRKKNICHCASCCSSVDNYTLHQENCDAPNHVNVAKYPQMLNIHDNLDKTTRNDNSDRIRSTMSHSTTLGMGDDSIQNPSNSYHSIMSYQHQLSQYGEDCSGLMTNPFCGLNLGIGPPTFFSPPSAHQNQHECQMKTDMGFYANLLTDKIPLHSLNLKDTSVIDDGGTSYGTGEGSNNSFSAGGFMCDPSGGLNLTPAMHNTSINEMVNPESGIRDGGIYGHGSFNGYGYGYGYGSGQFDYGDAMEVSNFEPSETTARTSSSPSEPHLNQHGFWF